MAESLAAYASNPEGLMRLVAVAVLGGILPAIFWLWFWLKEDRLHPEPKRLIFYAFISGAAMVPVAFYLEKGLEKIWLKYFSPSDSLIYLPLLAAPLSLSLVAGSAFLEEILKFLAVRLTVFQGRDFDEPIDAMIYLITAALGFAAAENSFHLFKEVLDGSPHTLLITYAGLRFLGATVLHVAASATLGAILAVGYCAHPRYRYFFPLGAFLAATILHLIFNTFIILGMTAGGLPQIYFWLWFWITLVIIMFEKVKSLTCKI